MTFDQIRTFLWVARLGGFRKAADRLNLTQPAVSTRIATLEEALGVPLFERGAGALVLTKHGQLLLTYAEQLLFVEQEIRQRVGDASQMEGLFRLGVSETVAQAWLPAFFLAFARAYPRVTIDLTVDISLNLRDALVERRLDLAILMGPVSDFAVENVPLPAFQLQWFKPAAMETVDFTQVPVMSYAHQTRPYRELSAVLTERFGPVVRIFSSASLSAALRMIAAGIAVGAYPRALAEQHLRDGSVVPFDPGIAVSPLDFTASFLAEPRNRLVETAARMAQQVAEDWHRGS